MTKSCEALRLLELERIDPLTTASEASFDIITQLVQRIMDVPFAAITVIDKDTQYLKARQGLDLETTPRSDAVCDIVVRSGNVLNIGDMRKDSRVQSNPAVRGSIGLQAYVGAPLTTKAGYHLGSLCALDTKPRQFTEYQIEILSNFAKLVSNLLELRAQADHDFLTKVLNRRGFEDVLRREMARIQRDGSPAVLAMMDLDHFKSVNDTYGHPVGDKVLKGVAEMVSGQLRKSDYLARMGGEEFALLLTNTTLEKSTEVVNRIHETVEAFRLDELPDLSVTVSIGLIDVAKCEQDFAGMMHEVDAAVYLAKSQGRNQTRTVSARKRPVAGGLSKAAG